MQSSQTERKTAVPTGRPGSETKSDLQTRIERQRAVAENGSVDAQYNLAWLLSQGTELQLTEALELLCTVDKASDIASKTYNAQPRLGLAVRALLQGNDAQKRTALPKLFELAEEGVVDPGAMMAIAQEVLQGKDQDLVATWRLQAAKVSLDKFGDAADQSAVGEWLFNRPEPESRHLAMRFSKSAAEAGQDVAQWNIAKWRLMSSTSPESDREAVRILRLLAKKDFTPAQLRLGYCLKEGRGCDKNEAEGRRWQERAAALGDPLASLVLALPDISPDIVNLYNPQNHSKLIHLFEPAHLRTRAELSHSEFGQALLCRYEGEGVATDVVVKVHRDKDPRHAAAFASEYLALIFLGEHPNVIKLAGFAVGYKHLSRSGELFAPPVSFVFPYYTNGSIEDLFKKPTQRHLADKLLVRWLLDVANGLAFLHANNVVHNDLAARNVFLDEQLRAVVGDLGLARRLDKEGKHVSKRAPDDYKRPQATSPEAMQGKCSAASDVFSVGVLVAEIATACQCDDDLMDKLEEFHQDEKVTLSLEAMLPSFVPAEIKALMIACLQRDPALRPSIATIIQTLENILGKHTRS